MCPLSIVSCCHCELRAGFRMFPLSIRICYHCGRELASVVICFGCPEYSTFFSETTSLAPSSSEATIFLICSFTFQDSLPYSRPRFILHYNTLFLKENYSPNESYLLHKTFFVYLNAAFVWR